MPYGMGPWGWYPNQYANPYWGWGRCRRFPWLPRWWWASMNWPQSPYGIPPASREDEIAMLEEEVKMLEQELARIKKRLEELKK